MFRYSFIIDSLLKAMGHKYIRRVPKGVTKTGATKYMYYYAGQEGHGKGIGHESELVTGASFAMGQGDQRHHAHISKVDGDKVTVRYDDGAKKGTEETMTKKQFQALVHGEHATGIKQAKENAEKRLKDFQAGKEKGVKVKQETLDKLEQRVKNLDALTAKNEEAQKPEAQKKTKQPRESTTAQKINPAEQPAKDLLHTLSKFLPEDKSSVMHEIIADPVHKNIIVTNAVIAIIVKKPQGFDFEKNSNDLPDYRTINANMIANMKKTKESKIVLTSENTVASSVGDVSRAVTLTDLYDNTVKNQATIKLPNELLNMLSSLKSAKQTKYTKFLFLKSPSDKTKMDIYYDANDESPRIKVADVHIDQKVDSVVTDFALSTMYLQDLSPMISKMYLPTSEIYPIAFDGHDSNTKGLMMPMRRW